MGAGDIIAIWLLAALLLSGLAMLAWKIGGVGEDGPDQLAYGDWPFVPGEVVPRSSRGGGEAIASDDLGTRTHDVHTRHGGASTR